MFIDTWFDPNTGKSCGPNIYDQDDDNDGFSDEKDAFPLDPCAQIDTDGDTQPDVLDCPEGYTSWLTEDMDDDGDGTPDVLEGRKWRRRCERERSDGGHLTLRGGCPPLLRSTAWVARGI